MVDKVFEDMAGVVQRYSGLSRKALDYCLFQKRIMDRARDKNSGYSPNEWLGLRDFVSADFERIGTFKEAMSFDDMIRFLQGWSPTTDWDGSFKRITEYDNVVILELEERVNYNGEANAVNTVSVFEYNSEGKLRHLDVYMQAVPAGGFPNPAYE